jgi:ATP phosphoribosyltransferase
MMPEVLSLLENAGYDVSDLRGASRSLVFDLGDLMVITVRPYDVPTYVEAGAADLGITGKDVLIEQRDRRVVELLDLGIGICRMVVAAPVGDEGPSEHERRLGMMRVATKYPRVAMEFFESRGRQVEVVEIKGSLEIAPSVGLADAIVDLVATGRTLKENGLEETEEIFRSSARLVANEVSYRVRADEGDRLAARLLEAGR